MQTIDSRATEKQFHRKLDTSRWKNILKIAIHNALKPRSYATADGPREAMYQSKSCQLLHNSVGTTCTTNPEQIEVIELEGYSRPTYSKLVHSATTRSTVVCVIQKLTVDEFCRQHQYPRRLAVAKFSKLKST